MKSRRRRLSSARAALIVAMLSLLFIDLGPRSAYSSTEQPSSGGRVTDVRFVVSGLKVIITYNLEGRRDAKYDVTLLLRKRSDPSFEYSPTALTGDVGLGEFAGQDRKITWYMSDEFPRGLQGSDFYFVINAREVKAGNSTSFLTWIGAGAAVIAAVVTYVFVAQSRGSNNASSFPSPPGRPK